MSFRTKGLLKQAENSPTGESSINNAERTFSDEPAARAFFVELKLRLSNLNEWNDKSGMSTFEIFDDTGRQVNDPSLKVDRFLKIKLPGSGKSDWVRVENIQNSDNEMIITLRPTFDPTGEPRQTGKTSHFFTSEATNNFCAFLDWATVYLYVIGLDEKLNSDHTDGIIETVRNTAVAKLGHYLGVQKAEWTKFCNSFLFEERKISAK